MSDTWWARLALSSDGSILFLHCHVGYLPAPCGLLNTWNVLSIPEWLALVSFNFCLSWYINGHCGWWVVPFWSSTDLKSRPHVIYSCSPTMSDFPAPAVWIPWSLTIVQSHSLLSMPTSSLPAPWQLLTLSSGLCQFSIDFLPIPFYISIVYSLFSAHNFYTLPTGLLQPS